MSKGKRKTKINEKHILITLCAVLAVCVAASNHEDTKQENSPVIIASAQEEVYEEEIEENADVIEMIDAMESEESNVTVNGDWNIGTDVYTALQNGIDAIESEGYNVGFILVDVETGIGVTYNADTSFYTASCIKAFYIGSLLTQDSSLLYSDISQLMEQAIVYSSNDAYQSLFDIYGEDPLNYYYELAGITDVRYKLVTHKYPDLSAKEMAKLWALNYELFTSAENGDAIAAMFTTPNQGSFVKYVSDATKTYTKAGWIATTSSDLEFYATNDGGLLCSEGRTFIVQILSDCPSDFSMISSLSQALVQAQQNLCAQLNNQ